jgi:hypothetical protein
MNPTKKQKLLNAGYRVMDTKEFLQLSDSEATLIEGKIAKEQRRQSTKPVPARRRHSATGGVLA